MKYLLPLALFVLLVVAFVYGLQHDPREIPSVLIDKPLPEFQLQDLLSQTVLENRSLPEHAFLLNVWASWCVACLNEHPLLLELAKYQIPIYGINYKDERNDALVWLQERGDPYVASLYDNKGSLGIELGVYGVPETFVIDRNHIIRYKHIGPVTEAALTNDILPLLEKLENE